MFLQPTVLITGAGQRIGRALAEHLGENGWKVGIHYHTSIQEATQLQEKTGGVLIQADLGKEEEIQGIIPETMEKLGRIDLLINNAAVFAYDSVVSADRESWDAHMEANLRAPFVLMQQFAKHFKPLNSTQGLVINMIDQRVWNLTRHFVSYSVSKYGLWGLTQTMALALAPSIRVNAIGPGPVLKSIHQTPEQYKAQCEQTPLGTGGDLEDIISAVEFLWKAKSVTGQMIAVDGGQHLGIKFE